MSGVVAIVVAVALSSVDDLKKPKSLLAFEAARERLVTGEVRWTVRHHNEPGFKKEREIRYVSRYARNGDRIVEQRGDQDGWTQWGRKQGEAYAYGKFPFIFLINGKGSWRYPETTMSADHWPAANKGTSREGRQFDGEPVPDIRFVGMNPARFSLRIGGRAVWTVPRSGEAPPGRTWSERRNGEIYTVTATTDDARTCTWIIDAEKGWNATRVTARDADGRAVFEVRSTIEKQGAVWFPTLSVYFTKERPAETYTINSCRFNRTGDPRAFSERAIGLEPYFNIIVRRDDSTEARFWTDKGLVDKKTWFELKKQGKVQVGRSVLARQRGEFKSPYRDEKKWQEAHTQAMLSVHAAARQRVTTEWERFVSDYTRRYGFDDDQRSGAAGILRDCQRRARRYYESRQLEFKAVQKEIAEAGADMKKNRTAGMKYSSLNQPINDIFEKSLKPRLAALRTGEQKLKEAELPASSKSTTRSTAGGPSP